VSSTLVIRVADALQLFISPAIKQALVPAGTVTVYVSAERDCMQKIAAIKVIENVMIFFILVNF
jgi:hypothetical protein